MSWGCLEKNRKSINDELKKYTYSGDESDFIEITEWANSDGVDIIICKSKSEKIISLSYDELDAIDYLIKSLKYNQ